VSSQSIRTLRHSIFANSLLEITKLSLRSSCICSKVSSQAADSASAGGAAGRSQETEVRNVLVVDPQRHNEVKDRKSNLIDLRCLQETADADALSGDRREKGRWRSWADDL
jgi:hypothetical protein